MNIWFDCIIKIILTPKTYTTDCFVCALHINNRTLVFHFHTKTFVVRMRRKCREWFRYKACNWNDFKERYDRARLPHIVNKDKKDLKNVVVAWKEQRGRRMDGTWDSGLFLNEECGSSAYALIRFTLSMYAFASEKYSDTDFWICLHWQIRGQL